VGERHALLIFFIAFARSTLPGPRAPAPQYTHSLTLLLSPHPFSLPQTPGANAQVGPGDVDLWRHDNGLARFWVDRDGKVHECYQFVKVPRRSSHVFFGIGTALPAFSVPALVRYADTDGTIKIYAAVAITLDDLIGPDNIKNATAATHRLKVVLAPPPPSLQTGPVHRGFHHVPISNLLPPEGEALQQPLPEWCTAIHAAFVTVLMTAVDADALVKQHSDKKLTKAAAAAPKAAEEAAAAEAAKAAEAADLGVGLGSLRRRGRKTPVPAAQLLDEASTPAEALTLAALRSELEALRSDVTKLGHVVFKRGKKGDLDTRMSDVEARMGDAEKRLPPKGKKSPPPALTAKDVKQLVADEVGSVDFSAIVKAEVKAALKREHENERDGDDRSARRKSARSEGGAEDTYEYYQGLLAAVVHGNLQEHQLREQRLMFDDYQRQQLLSAHVGGMHVGGMVGMGGAGPATWQPLNLEERKHYEALCARAQSTQPI
jgi:hypothetical protein